MVPLSCRGLGNIRNKPTEPFWMVRYKIIRNNSDTDCGDQLGCQGSKLKFSASARVNLVEIQAFAQQSYQRSED